MAAQVGVLHPGAMGISVAATLQNNGCDVWWASAGRSQQSRERAEQHNLHDAATLPELCARCEMIVSVCPPHAAEATADDVLQMGFRGLYIDANAISPQRAQHIGQKLEAAGIRFVDGGIIGGPAWKPRQTWLNLSGADTEQAASYFAAGPLETEVIGAEIGKASALKMCFAANSKGITMLLCAVMAAAEQLGVRDALEHQWMRDDPAAPERNRQRVRQVTAKAWRFAGEMDEIADTFAEAGLPDGFHRAASEVYDRMAQFKDAAELPALADVLAALVEEGKDEP